MYSNIPYILASILSTLQQVLDEIQQRDDRPITDEEIDDVTEDQEA